MPVSNPIESPIVQENGHLRHPSATAAEAPPSLDRSAAPTEDYPQVSAPTAPAQAAPGHPIEESREETLWEGRYSLRNFLGRLAIGVLLVVGWLVLAVATWGFGRSSLVIPAYLLGVVVLIYGLVIGMRILRMICGRRYWLTNKRLFLSTGLFRRRVDQVELVRVKDVYLKQTMIERWVGIGHVHAVSSEETLPRAVLLGIEGPMRVMDLIWRATRGERDRRTTEINHI